MLSEVFSISWSLQTTHIVPFTVTRYPKNELVKACVGSIKANGYALTLSDPIQFHSHIMGRPTDAVGGVFKLATPNGPYCTFYGDQTPKNELVKACVGSIKANGYALTLSDPIQFHSHIMRRPTDAV